MEIVRIAPCKIKHMRRFAAGATLIAALLAGCAQAPLRTPQHTPAPVTQPLARIELAPGPGQAVAADLLQAEFALAHNDLKTAAAATARAAMLSSDPAVAERAVALAVAVHDAPLAAQALARWQALGSAPGALAAARAQLALDQGDRAGAEQQLDAVIVAGGANAWRDALRVLASARDPALAGVVLENLATPARLPADDSVIWLAASQLGAHLGRHAFAQSLAAAALSRFGSAASYGWLAQLAQQAGDLKTAQATLRAGLTRHPRSISLRMALAGLLAARGDNTAAQRLLAQGTQDAGTYAARAAYAARGNDRKALATIYAELARASAAVRKPNLFLLGQLAELLDRHQAALDWYAQVAEGDPHAFDADVRRVVLLSELGRGQQAQELLRGLQNDYADEPKASLKLLMLEAEMDMRAHRYAEAVTVYGRALQRSPNDPGLLYARGVAAAEAGAVDQAVTDLRQVLALKPGDVNAMNALGYTLADARRELPEAEKLVAAAHRARPDDPAITDSWGWVQFRLGHLDEAERSLRKAWDKSKDAEIGAHLAAVLWAQGRHAEARAVLMQAHKLDPHSRSVHALQARWGA